MDSNDAGSSPGAVKEKLSLRKRLLIKKSTKVGCSPDNNDDSLEKSVNEFSKSSGDIFLSKRVYENGDRTYCSDSEASTSNGKGRLSSSTSSFLTCSQTSMKSYTRPRSMIEDTLNKSGDMKNSVVVHKSIEILKRPHIHKARSDPNCDSQCENYNGIRNGTYSNESVCDAGANRMSSSLSDVQRSSDEYEINNKFLASERDSSALSSESSKCKEENSTGTPRCGSADSLARNSLLAAKVLRLIPTQKARERNFLLGRLASNSLLGAAELDRVFPNREVEIFVGTWNMNGQPPPNELNDFLFPNTIKNVPDILAIGSQESTSEKAEWEITIQESLGPSHLLFHSAVLGTLYLCIFIRRDLIWFCSLPEDSSISVRPGTAFRTKGAVAISFALFGTSFLFITSHLTAHQGKVKERVHDIKRIIRSLDLPKNLPIKHKSKDVTANFDIVMWCGDLNFRLSEDRDFVMRGLRPNDEPNISNIHKAMSTSDIIPTAFPSLLQADQLSAVLASGTVLKGFKEGPIYFPPTYKYDPGTQRFDTSSKQRTPAYTDRILYKTKTQPHISLSSLRKNSTSSNLEHTSCVKCLAYDSVPSICSSDHKPVWALFTATLRPGIDIVPLAAGLFNREVYLEGIKRRAAMLDHPPGTSAICSIQ